MQILCLGAYRGFFLRDFYSRESKEILKTFVKLFVA